MTMASVCSSLSTVVSFGWYFVHDVILTSPRFWNTQQRSTKWKPGRRRGVIKIFFFFLPGTTLILKNQSVIR